MKRLLLLSIILLTFLILLSPLVSANAEVSERIADNKPTVKEEFYSNGKLKSRTNFQPKSDGGEHHGPDE